jgi:hypothetical protein
MTLERDFVVRERRRRRRAAIQAGELDSMAAMTLRGLRKTLERLAGQAYCAAATGNTGWARNSLSGFSRVVSHLKWSYPAFIRRHSGVDLEALERLSLCINDVSPRRVWLFIEEDLTKATAALGLKPATDLRAAVEREEDRRFAEAMKRARNEREGTQE